MAYRVELPEKLSGVHDVFHVSHLRKCLHETAEVVEPSFLREVEIERDATIRRAPTCILGSDIKKLRNREVKLLKVQWGDDESNTTWERKRRCVHCTLFFSTVCLLISPLSPSLYLFYP